MPGTVTAVPVPDGETVDAGATVVVIEAMKMEHPLTTPVAGTLRVTVRPGDQVRLGQVVAVVEPATDPTPEPAKPGPAEPRPAEPRPAEPRPAEPGPTGTADPAVPASLSDTRGDS
jgi:acetyl-CoA/propionyl-CoA carboxylase biotin carboxyl carrier protein